MSERRLPVYLLLDVSGSMEGEPIQAVNTGIQQLIADLNDEPDAVQTAWLSVITFSDTANRIVELTRLPEFQVPELKADGSTALGPALSLLCECWEKDRLSGTGPHTGDFRPLVFLMTDGEQNEGDFEKGVRDFKAHHWGSTVLLAAGPYANVDDLKKINPERVFKMDSLAAGDLQKFFRFVTASVKTQSQKKVDSDQNGVQAVADEFPPMPDVMQHVSAEPDLQP